MSVLVAPDQDTPVVTLETAESAPVAELGSALAGRATAMVDDPSWITAAADGWDALPTRLRRSLRAFRRDSGPHGALLLRGLPIGPLPETPNAPGSVQRTASVPAAVLAMVACGLGDPAAFRAEKSGALVQNVVPVPGQETFQGNAGSVLLELHNENAFHAHRPDFVLLLCLRPDHERVARLHTACIRQALPILTEDERETLSSHEFVTQAPPSFGLDSGAAEAHAVLTGDPEDPDLRVDFSATHARTARGAAALRRLQRALGDVAVGHHLLAGDLAVVDNRVSVHGRSEFRPRYDGADRWLQRTFVLADLRRSRGLRPGDGHVLHG